MRIFVRKARRKKQQKSDWIYNVPDSHKVIMWYRFKDIKNGAVYNEKRRRHKVRMTGERPEVL